MQKIEKMNEKGVMGLDTVKGFMLILLTLAVIGVAMFLGLTAVIDSSNSLRYETLSGTFSNETIVLNWTGNVPATAQNKDNIALSSVLVTNATGGEIVNSANYSVTGGTLKALTAEYNNTNVNVSASFTYRISADGQNVVNNVTTGATDFFSNIPTIFAILGAVIIILAVSLILFAVSRFGKTTGVDTNL